MQILLGIHIVAGAIALATAVVAVGSEKGRKIHVTAGRIYFWSMVIIFATALPMSVLTSNMLLFLVSIFSFYLAFAGRRFAKNRSGTPETVDWMAVALMLASGAGMWILAGVYFVQGNSQYVVLLVFGFFALFLGLRDGHSHLNKTATGKQRIARHLTNMMGGTIAVITAFLTVNVQIENQWLVWILPTLLIVPLIAWWNVKVSR